MVCRGRCCWVRSRFGATLCQVSRPCAGAATEAQDGPWVWGGCRGAVGAVGSWYTEGPTGPCCGMSRRASAMNLAASALASSRGRPRREETTESSAPASEVVASFQSLRRRSCSSAPALTFCRIDRACIVAGIAAGAIAGSLLGEETALRFRELRGRGVGVAGSEGGSDDSKRCGVPGRASAARGSSTSIRVEESAVVGMYRLSRPLCLKILTAVNSRACRS